MCIVNVMAKKLEGLAWPEGLVCEVCGAGLHVPPGTPPGSEVYCPVCGAVYETYVFQ